MATFNTFKLIIVTTALVSLLGGCVTKRPGTSSDMAEPPAPKSQNLEQEEQLGIAPSRQTDADITYPQQVSSKQSIFGRKESTQVKSVPVSYADMEFVQQRFSEYQVKLDEWLEISEIDDKRAS